jgi:ParB-like chromosome segregation protein Spo0J
MTHYPESFTASSPILETIDVPLEHLAPSEFQDEIYGYEDVDQALVQSLIHEGQLQPVLVWGLPRSDGRYCYEIVSGHRRVAAARVIGWATIRCEVTVRPDDVADRRRIMIATNTQRTKSVHQMVQECIALGAFGGVAELPDGSLVAMGGDVSSRAAASMTGQSRATISFLRIIFDDAYQLERLSQIDPSLVDETKSTWEDIRYDCIHESLGCGIRESAALIAAMLQSATEEQTGSHPPKDRPAKAAPFGNASAPSSKPILVRDGYAIHCTKDALLLNVGGKFVQVNADHLANLASKFLKKSALSKVS